MNRDIEKHKKPPIWLLVIIEVVLIAVMVVAIVVFVHNHMSGLIIALKSGSEREIETYIHNTRMGTSMVLLFLMQVIQVVSIMIPGAPIQIAASVALDLEIGFVICYLGFIFGNFFIFTVARLMGGTIKRFLPQEGIGKKQVGKGVLPTY